MKDANTPINPPSISKGAHRERIPKRRFRMKRVDMPRVSRSAVPSTFTVMNMVCGYASIVMASEQNFVAAGWLIILAAILDTIDGFVARLTNSSSDFGIELDSLSDLVSFGAAPSFLAYKLGLETFGIAGLALSSALMVGSGLRLARYNLQTTAASKSHFSGLPTPSQAMTIAAFAIWTSSDTVFPKETQLYLLIALTVTLTLLMISSVRYDRLPKPTQAEFAKQPVKLSCYLIAFVAIGVFQAKGFFFAMIAYIIYGIAQSIYEFFFEETSSSPLATTSDGINSK
ncbi:MAG: CDP-diacylglycerol--serine O-phosphatidyltransferase [[Candidatus Thermochlorobacteriaceae] bacterium GBChlB]|nr:MAG: CDP-diacylglycerol--serine O-phosphatidyltransferase [[Candidatus Thermochlorobacteriaceae] bacterium GBChlB]